MSRHPKDYEIFSGRICRESADKLNQIRDETGLTKTVIVEKAIDRYYEYYKKSGKIN